MAEWRRLPTAGASQLIYLVMTVCTQNDRKAKIKINKEKRIGSCQQIRRHSSSV
jgi:hypothetical protein